MFALLLLACNSDEAPPSLGSTLGSDELAPIGEPPAPLGPSSRARSRDGRLTADIPVDLVVQPFASTIMATSPDGSFRLHIEPRKGGLLEVLGPLKDELIALGWELESEKHFASAINLQLGHGVARSRVTRAIWLLERNAAAPSAPSPPSRPGPPAQPAPTAAPASPPAAAPPAGATARPTAVSVLCEAQAKGPGLYRLGNAHRGICQSIEVASPNVSDPTPR